MLTDERKDEIAAQEFRKEARKFAKSHVLYFVKMIKEEIIEDILDKGLRDEFEARLTQAIKEIDGKEIAPRLIASTAGKDISIFMKKEHKDEISDYFVERIKSGVHDKILDEIIKEAFERL